MKNKIENNAEGSSSTNEFKKVLYSKIENGVLLKFDERDAEDGHFECSEITEVGEGAFSHCENLTSVNLPKVKKLVAMRFIAARTWSL